MGVIHYLNVKDGDCSIIKHPSGHTTMIDVSNATSDIEDDVTDELKKTVKEGIYEALSVSGNFNQKAFPVNPIKYLQSLGESSIFRFILTHPDMDHMSGIKDIFSEFSPQNFWDTDNECEKEFEDESRWNEDDWKFYKNIRDTNPQRSPKRLTLFSGAKGSCYNKDGDGDGGGDGLHVLAPTKELLKQANETDDYNDASYVILYRSNGRKILFAGDSNDKTWEHILKNHKKSVMNVDLLIAPHHGRKSDRSYDFLDIVNPTMTFFGNANSEHLAYSAWSSRDLPVITNNQANCMIVDTNTSPMEIYVTNKKFAESYYKDTWYSDEHDAYYIGDIDRD